MGAKGSNSISGTYFRNILFNPDGVIALLFETLRKNRGRLPYKSESGYVFFQLRTTDFDYSICICAPGARINFSTTHYENLQNLKIRYALVYIII